MTNGGPTALAPRPGRRHTIRFGVAVGIIVVAIVAFLLFSLDNLLVDRLWFESVGQLQVWDVSTFSRLLLWMPVSLVTFGLLIASIAIAIRIVRKWPVRARPTRADGPPEAAGPYGQQPTFDDVARDLLARIDKATSGITARRAWLLLTLAAALVALVTGFVFSAQWQTILLWTHQASSIPGLAAAGPGATPTPPVVDPIFGRPLTFYLFDLPFYRWAVDLVGWVLDALIVLTAIAYLVFARRALTVPSGRAWAWHLGILVALRIGIGAIGFQLDKFSLATSQETYPYPAGVDATDAAVRIPGADLMSVLTVIAAIVVLAAIVARRWRWALGAFGAWVALGIGIIGLAILNQALFVNPNPLDQQRRYIVNDIAATRTAFGLDAWTTRSYPASTSLSADAIVSEADTFSNARLWDDHPLRATLDQLQTVRQYYDFTDVDNDRYPIDGRERDVMLSAREMALDKNPAVANWLNSHFVYTHGYGLAMLPASGVGSDGLPELLIRDLPVTSEAGAPTVTEPRIYFGERPSPWIITGAQTAEFDYPVEQGSDATTRWTAKTGIDVSGGLNRLLVSLRTGDFISLLTTPQITSDSQFVMRRTLSDRLSALAPFLAFDKDPYLVVTSTGRLVWIVDAYTASGNFPMARALDGNLRNAIAHVPTDQVNYLRNSVKVVVDAYDGTTKLYVNDPSDPLIATWASIYPTLFTPLSELPDDLQAHLRYPRGLFNAQTAMYGAYHVTDATTFYQGDNLWTVPVGTEAENRLVPNEAYYVQMRLPDEAETEYLLMQPMVPARRPNMISWVSARNDGPERGKVLVYKLPADTTIYGPDQIEALIDQTPEISSQITLWDQSGSKVIRGDLIVVPVGGSFVYLQPIYLQSTSSAFPQFTKIVVATPSKVVWANTLADALQKAVGPGGPAPTPGPNATPGPDSSPAPEGLPSDINGLIAYANLHFDLAQQAMGSGDYVTYGEEMALVQVALDRLAQLSATTAAGDLDASAAHEAPAAGRVDHEQSGGLAVGGHGAVLEP